MKLFILLIFIYYIDIFFLRKYLLKSDNLLLNRTNYLELM